MNEQELNQYRKPYQKDIRLVRMIMYVGTAAFFAAAASDLASNATASALGNLGLVMILVRLYFLSPLIVAKARKGAQKWVEAEADELFDRYPWADQVGRAGWWLLILAVDMQLFLGYA